MRTRKIQAQGDAAKTNVAADMTRIICTEGLDRIEMRARETLAAVMSGDTLSTTLAGLRRVIKHTPLDTVTLRRQVADVLIDSEKWPL